MSGKHTSIYLLYTCVKLTFLADLKQKNGFFCLTFRGFLPFRVFQACGHPVLGVSTTVDAISDAKKRGTMRTFVRILKNL